MQVPFSFLSDWRFGHYRELACDLDDPSEGIKGLRRRAFGEERGMMRGVSILILNFEFNENL